MSQVGECMFIIGLRKYLFKGMINLKRGLSRALKLDIYRFTIIKCLGLKIFMKVLRIMLAV